MKFRLNLTIARRLQVVGTALFAFIAVLAWVVWSSFSDVNQGQYVALNMQKGASKLQLVMRGLNESAMTQGASASVNMARRGIADFSRLHEELISLTSDDPQLHAFLSGDWYTRWKEIQPSIETFLAESEDIDFEDIDQMVAFGKLSANAGELADELGEQAEQLRGATIETVTQNLAIGAAVILSLFAFVGIALARSITRPISRLKNFVVQVEQSSDLASRIDWKNRDELGEIAMALNAMLGKFQSILREVSSDMEELSNKAHDVRETADNTSQGIGAQQASIGQIASSMTEMTASVQEISHNTAAASSNAEQAKRDSDVTRVAVDKAARTTGDLASQVQHAADVIKELNDRTGHIGQVLDVIRDIAEQTNLLALNAAIEAARAGEQGRGFAVVADEVRTLATRTQGSTEEIQEIITQLQKGAENATRVMDEGRTQAAESVEQTTQAVEALANVTSAIGTMADISAQIASATEQQTATAEEMNRNLTQINAVAEDTADRAHKTAAANSDIDNLILDAVRVINQFRL